MSAESIPPFVHLHVHTHYSLLDGATRIPDLVAACKRMNMPAVAVTDHGNLFGAIDFYRAAKAAGVKPIIGLESYIAPGDRREKGDPGPGRESNYHLLLLAADNTGYKNLIKLASIGYMEGFYYKPRIDKQVLREFSAGLLCTSTCLAGEVPQAFMKKDFGEAKRVAEEYLDIFGPDRFFIELQNHGMTEQREMNPELSALAKRLGVATIATNDVHYLTHDDVEAHDILCCINTRARVIDQDRFKFPSDQFFLKSPEEMAGALPEYADALAQTLRVAEMCNVDLDFTKRYAPVYTPPAKKTADAYLRELVNEGAKERYGEISPELRERIDYELSVIASKGFSSYFLIVWDFGQYARQNDIPCSARGSGCSTVVGYCLRISDVDPLAYGLYFERFMDPERDEMPDIDMDMCQDRRPEVIDYVRQKYGHVAQIITFGTLKARAAIRDVCRTLDIPLSEADRVAKLIPEELKMTVEKALEREPELKRICDTDERFKKVLDIATRLEGLARHASVHAAGVVIADQPLDELIPLYKAADSNDIITQFEGGTVEKVGLLKMDFLGLRTLSQIHLACKLVRQNHGIRIDLEKLDLADEKVYALLARGDTKGIFQFESGGMRDVLLKMKPNRIFDLIAANALFRPGPMAYINDYCARKHGKSWETPHPIMTEVLSETYGVMVYQEQVSRLVNRLGDVPLRRAFRLAKAISKKNTGMIEAEREPFLAGAAKNGVSRQTGEKIFADILEFGGYAFNKAHSSGYSLLAFQTAYLKTYYPVEFMAAVLTYESGNSDKIAEYIHECRRIRQADGSVGIPVQAPDVNESDMAFTVVYDRVASSEGQKNAELGTRNAEHGKQGALKRGRILFGLAAISGLGEKAVTAILSARREGGRFRDVYDFCERVDLSIVNKSAIESLIRCGAFDSTGAMRRALIEVLPGAVDRGGARFTRGGLLNFLPHIIEHGQSAQRDRRAGQMSMFGGAGGFGADADAPPPPIPAVEWSESEMLMHEKQTLGFYVTAHPLAQHEDVIRQFSTTDTVRLKQMGDGTSIILGGIISKVRDIPIKNGRSAGKKMAALTIEDLTGSVEAIVFPDSLEKLRPLLRPDSVVFIAGNVDKRREEASVRVERVIPVENATIELSRTVLVRLSASNGVARQLSEMRDLCKTHRGRCRLRLQIESEEGWATTIAADDNFNVTPNNHFLTRMAGIVGQSNVSCLVADF